MKTYKTFKSTNEEGKVEMFINQFDNVLVLVLVNSREYSFELLDETKDERSEGFFFEYGLNNADAKKAFALMQKEID